MKINNYSLWYKIIECIHYPIPSYRLMTEFYWKVASRPSLLSTGRRDELPKDASQSVIDSETRVRTNAQSPKATRSNSLLGQCLCGAVWNLSLASSHSNKGVFVVIGNPRSLDAAQRQPASMRQGGWEMLCRCFVSMQVSHSTATKWSATSATCPLCLYTEGDRLLAELLQLCQSCRINMTPGWGHSKEQGSKDQLVWVEEGCRFYGERIRRILRIQLSELCYI